MPAFGGFAEGDGGSSPLARTKLRCPHMLSRQLVDDRMVVLRKLRCAGCGGRRSRG